MPRYDYRCRACGETFDSERRADERVGPALPLANGPTCGAGGAE
ncbi:FmdB family zinc ribbon protein [Nocardiopsis mangrovi]|uniref:FmdB family zinc ribbon protein n=1 Tax=Nocardiopsis mangrovi TaxID=1179818 RepID=A0ABV9DSA2_9ACTN